MFAIFGLGPQEIVILLLMGLMSVGGPVLAVVVALYLTRRSEGTVNPDAVAELRAEVERLREECERLKKGSA
jgi:ubiquinone biosynthesis protein UbiJ